MLTLSVPVREQAEDGSPKDPRVQVESEDQPDRLLLETHICKEDGFQKQQGKSRDLRSAKPCESPR